MVKFEVNGPKKRLMMVLEEDLSSGRTNEIAQAWEAFQRTDNPEAWKTLYFDLRETRILDSVGLNWLFSFVRQLEGAGKKMVVRVSSPAIKRVLDYACFAHFAEIRFRRRRQTH